MTRPDLDALAALLERATPGPWYECSGLVTPSHRLFTETRHENAALIVAAVNALPDLLAYVRELEQWQRDMVAKAAENSLAGYRELGARAATAERERDDAMARVRELERERDQAISIRNVFADGLVRSVVDKTANLQGQPVDKTAELQARAAALAMRERAAQACESVTCGSGYVLHLEGHLAAVRKCAAAIRALEV